MWQRVTIESKNEIDIFLNNNETSDLNMTTLLLWSEGEKLQYKIDEDILYVKGEIQSEEYYFPPMTLEKDKIYKAFEKIKNKRVALVPEKIKKNLEEKYNFLESRDSFDYIYLQKDLSELKGRKFTSKKNKINKFKKMYNFTYEKITKENIKDVLKFQREWVGRRPDSEILNLETKGVEMILENYFDLNLRGGLIKVDGSVIAYAFGEKITDDMGVIHIEKGFHEYIGCYQMINQYVAKEEFSDVKYINREDDSGDPGLREAKESYQPIMFLKKFRYNVEDKNV